MKGAIRTEEEGGGQAEQQGRRVSVLQQRCRTTYLLLAARYPSSLRPELQV